MCGFHEYQAIWSPTLDEELNCSRETDNPNDPYAVSVLKGTRVVGHVPRRMCAIFLRSSGTITCTVTGNRRYSHDLPQGGMEIPCTLNFFGEDKWLKKISKLCEDLHFGHKTEGCVGENSENGGKITEDAPVQKRAMMDDSEKIILVDSPVEEEVAATSDVWVKCDTCVLNVKDKETVDTGMELTDRHIQFSQHLIKKQFSTIGGLCSTLLQTYPPTKFHSDSILY